MIDSDVAIQLLKVSKTYKIKERSYSTIRQKILNIFNNSNKTKIVKALNNIELTINAGSVLGIIGRNGSGKSTLLNIIMGSIKPDKAGTVYTKGKMMRLSLGMGVDNSLTARDNIYVNGSVIGLSFKKIGQIFDEIITFAGLENFVDTPVKFYSKGMRQRLLFSIAMHAEADIFLLDEFFGGTGDQDFKKKSDIAFNKRIVERKTLIIVSHNLTLIEKYCDKVLWIDKGNTIGYGKPFEIIENYKNSFVHLESANH